MPRLKSRSTKIQPCSDNGVGGSSMVFTKVMPNLDVFGRTNVTNNSCRSHPNLKLNSNKTSYKILSRMDDPEEVYEFSSASSGLIRHSVSLPIYNTATLQVTPGRFASCRSSVDFSRLHATSDLMVKSPQGNDHKSGIARTEKIIEKCKVWSKLETRGNDIDPKSSVNNTIDTRNKKPWQKSQKLTHSEVDSATKHSDILEWTANPEKCYLCILNFKQETESSDSRASLSVKNRTNHQAIVVHDLEDYRLVSYSPEVLVFSAVENNLPVELENTLANSSIDLNFCYNSKKLTPLHLAAQLGFTQCVQVLLKHGSNVNCLNSKNHSPLYMAFTGQHYECAILLIEAGADIRQLTAQKNLTFNNENRYSVFPWYGHRRVS